MHKSLIKISLMFVVGGLGAQLARWVGLPLPYMLGSLSAVAAFAILNDRWVQAKLDLPKFLRTTFIAIVGVLIGATFSPGFLSLLSEFWISLCAVLVFVALAQATGYVIFRKIGGYSRVNALYSSMPGGLIEAVILGEQAGGDVRLLSVQHFARVTLVIVTVPMLFLLFSGQVVGSSAGQQLSVDPSGPADLAIIGLCAAAGFVLGGKLKLPASHLVGPLLLSGFLHASGLVDTASPSWLLDICQLVIGVGLGAQFSGLTLKLLARAFGLGAIVVAAMLSISLAIALLLTQFVNQPFDALFISMAPGGVTEMGLIALSLNASPVFVAAHHVFRISVTVLVVGWLNKWLKSMDSTGSK